MSGKRCPENFIISDKNPGKNAGKNPRKRYGVIGYPVAQSASPRMHRYWGVRHHKRICYDAYEVPAQAFTSTVTAFFARGGRGLNVTVPHKEAALRMSDESSERARACGAANFLQLRKDKKLFADNTDGSGLVHDLQVNEKISLRGKRIAILGAGGAARGILLPILEQRPSRLLLTNRSPARAVQVTRELSGGGDIEAGAFDDLAGATFDVLINATSAGLKGSFPALPGDLNIKDGVCYDLAYGPAALPFMQYAKSKGAARSLDGWGMLVEQAAESFLLWFGVRPDSKDVRAQRKKFIPRDNGS